MQATVVVIPEPAHEGTTLSLVCLVGADPSCGPDHALELRRRRVPGELEQIRFALGVGDTRKYAHLGIAELAVCESRLHEREVTQLARDPDVLPGRPRRNRTTPSDPFRRRAASGPCPSLSPVELVDELKPAGAFGRDPGGERLELTLDELEWEVRRSGLISGPGAGNRREHMFVE